MKLFAKRPCNFGGKTFYIGDEVPAEFVLDPEAQEKMGVLVKLSTQGHPAPAPVPVQEEPKKSTITVRVPVEEGELPLDVTEEGIQAVFSVLTANAADAEPIIGQMTDGDALILLHLADSRKTIKAAAETRAKDISASQEEPESEGEQ